MGTECSVCMEDKKGPPESSTESSTESSSEKKEKQPQKKQAPKKEKQPPLKVIWNSKTNEGKYWCPATGGWNNMAWKVKEWKWGQEEGFNCGELLKECSKNAFPKDCYKQTHALLLVKELQKYREDGWYMATVSKHGAQARFMYYHKNSPPKLRDLCVLNPGGTVVLGAAIQLKKVQNKNKLQLVTLRGLFGITKEIKPENGDCPELAISGWLENAQNAQQIGYNLLDEDGFSAYALPERQAGASAGIYFPSDHVLSAPLSSGYYGVQGQTVGESAVIAVTLMAVICALVFCMGMVFGAVSASLLRRGGRTSRKGRHDDHNDSVNSGYEF